MPINQARPNGIRGIASPCFSAVISDRSVVACIRRALLGLLLGMTVILSGCACSGVVRDIGVDREVLRAKSAVERDGSVYVEYERSTYGNKAPGVIRVQQIFTGKDNNEVTPRLIFKDVQSERSELAGVVVEKIESDHSSSVNVGGKPLSIEGISRDPIFRYEYSWYHYPSQVLFVVSVPLDIVTSPIQGAYLLSQMGKNR
jgi:hypothetical protein